MNKNLLDVLDDVEGELLEHELGLRVALVGEHIHVTGVGSLPGKSQESALLVHHFRHLIRGKSLFFHDIRNDVGIDITAARTHNHTLERRKSHGRIHALSVLHGGNRASVAKMACDNLGIAQLETGKRCSPAGNILMRCSVCTVATHAIFYIVLIRKCIHISIRLHGLVERGIERHHLRHIRKDIGHGMDAEKVRRIVQRSKVAAYLYLAKHIVVDKSTS